MTAAEINTEFNLRYNEETNYEGSGFSPKEKSVLLTYAQEQVLKKYYPLGDRDEEVRRYLVPIKTNTAISSTASGYYTNGYMFTLPTDHKYTIGEQCVQVFNSNSVCIASGTERTLSKIKPITEDYYGVNIENPFKKPYKELVWRLDRYSSSTHSVELVGDDTFEIRQYKIVYYKTAKPIIVPYNYTASQGSIRGYNFSAYTGGLASEVEELHTEIIGEAIRIATAATKDQLGYQLQSLEEKLNNNIN